MRRSYEAAGFWALAGFSDRSRIPHVISLGKGKYRFPAVGKGEVRIGGSGVAAYEPQV
jgi:hypothetical protein